MSAIFLQKAVLSIWDFSFNCHFSVLGWPVTFIGGFQNHQHFPLCLLSLFKS
jgi:hypothetical protein